MTHPLGANLHGLAVLSVAALIAAAGAATAQLAPEPSWVRTLDAGGMDLGEGAAVDAAGNTYVTGIAEVAGQQDMLTAKYLPDGSLAWSRAIDRTVKDRGEDVAVAADGVVAVGSIATLGGDDVLVVKYGPEGELLWNATFDKGTAESARGVSVDPEGNVFVAGTSLSMNGADGFLAKLTPDGEEVWSRPINLFYLDEAFDVAPDGAGGAFVVGRVLRQTDFDLLLRRFDADGGVAWTRFVATGAREEGRGVAAAPDGGAFVVGSQQVATGGSVTDDVLVARFEPDGTLAWTRTLDIAGGDDAGRDVALDASGNLFVTGFGDAEGGKDAALWKLAPDGDEIWRTVHEDDAVAGTGAVALGPGGRIVIAGARQVAEDDYAYLLLAFDEPPPSAAFLARATRTATVHDFEDASAPGLRPIVAWSWDFGDGHVSSEQNPTHDYAYGGAYPVLLTVTDEAGSRSTATKTITVDGPPRPQPVAPSPGPAPASPAPPPAAEGAVLDENVQGPTEETPAPGAILVLAALLLAALALRSASRRR